MVLTVLAIAFLVGLGTIAFRAAKHPHVSAPVSATPSTLLAVALRGVPEPAVAIVASGGPQLPAAVAFPNETTFTLPGQGEGTVREAAMLPGSSFRISVSNLVGDWASHYLVMDRKGLTALVDRMDGIDLQLTSTFEAGGQTFGPGDVTLDGPRVTAFLAVKGPNLLYRWELVLGGLLAEPVPVMQGDLLGTDDLSAARRALEAARGATVEAFPTEDLGTLVQPDASALPAFRREVLGSPAPITATVMNGVGTPGIGERVAARIIPAGFHVVVSENTERFGRARTQVIASSEDQVAQAELAREALGVGEVVVSKVPSGLADVTIVVGRDFGYKG